MLCVADFCERLDVDKLREAWELLVERHEILRTTFEVDERGAPVQSVHPDSALPWRLVDWSAETSADQAAYFDTLLNAEGLQKFGHGSRLFRLTLVRMGTCHYQLVWASHHGILDASSLVRLLKELFFIYDASQRGEPPKLPAAVGFQSFAEWLGSRDTHASEEFWSSAMQDVTRGTSLDFGGDVAPVRDGEGSPAQSFLSHQVQLPASLAHELQTLCQSRDLTLTTLTQAAWAILLNRYTGQEIIVFAATRSGRESPPDPVSEAVGPLITTVPIPVCVAPSQTCSDLLATLSRLWTEMRPHEHMPLDRIRELTPLAADAPWLESLVDVQNDRINAHLHLLGDGELKRSFRLQSRTHYPLVLSGAECDPVEFCFT